MRLVLAVLLILTSPLALAIQVQGEGSSFEEAKQSAFKVAIDQEVGVILDTERHLKNGKIVHNQILSYSAGYIISSSLIHHVIIRDRNLHQVTFDVTVASSLLKDFVLSSNHNTKSFNIDDIKAQTQSSKETHKDGMDLLDSTLKFFPNKAFNIEMHDFSVIVNYHDPRKFHLHVPYTLSWNQEYLVALQEALTVYGKIGIKVWICKGEVLGKRDLSPNVGVDSGKGGRGDRRGGRDNRRGNDRRR